MTQAPERFFLKFRRLFNTFEWSAHLLGLPKSQGTASVPGLVMIQIDGLSKAELDRALRQNEMPCLKRLLSKEHYHLYSLYPGLPSATPAVQGELFYGVSQCIPSFFYYDRNRSRLVDLANSEDVLRHEQELRRHGPGLLQGGSSYCNIFTGAAKESHFCASSLGWDKVWKDINLINFLLLLLTHLWTVLRTAVLIAYEFILASMDFLRGIFHGENLFAEFRLLLLRPITTAWLRELVTVGARIDIARGLPVIHLNFLGYDELAHRRGPCSKAAHWTLPGIDRCIAKIYADALHSTRRHYDLWVYSDHGQQEMVPYATTHDRNAADVIAEIFSRVTGANPKEIIVVAKGGVGHLYWSKPLSFEQARSVAKALVHQAKVPLVLAVQKNDQILAWNEHGEWGLPQDGARILEDRHPYYREVITDIEKTCRHPQAGNMVIYGLRPHGRYDNFVFEHGDHGGPGIAETDAFAILSSPMIPYTEGRTHIRVQDLRACALRMLGHGSAGIQNSSRHPVQKKTVRLMTYNVHSCIGMDGKVSAERVARVISRFEPDIIALQELDLKRPKTGGEDQPHLIARHLEMLYHFHPTIQIEEEQYGNAILSRFPMRIQKAGELPQWSNSRKLEPRGALWAEIDLPDGKLQLMATHLSIFHAEALKQARTLAETNWLNNHRCQGPVVLCGDFNSLPGSPAYRFLTQHLQDAQLQLKGHRPRPTWFSRYPFGRIDHVFVNSLVKVEHVQVPQHAFYRLVSDHLPLIVDISL